MHRVKRNLIASGVESAEGDGTIEGGRPPVTDGDLSFMIASMQKLKREINPHWWYAASIF